jgi:NMT1-like family
MSARTLFAGMVGALLVAAVGGQAGRAEPLRIGYNIWVGFGPLFVAREKGFFAKEGVEVELVNMAIYEAIAKAAVFENRRAEFQALARALGCRGSLCRGPSRRGQRDHGAQCRRLARGSRGLRRDPKGRPVL